MLSEIAELPPSLSFNPELAKAFAGRMMDALNDAALVLMTSVGHRTRLFDTFAGATPCTSAHLAAQSGLAERYVREWLTVMVTAGVVDYDPAARLYSFPAEHAALLTRGMPKNLAVLSQFITVFAQVEDDMIHCFETGHGLHYHDYGRFHDVMAEQTGQSLVANLVEHILPLVPGLIARLEGGIDVLDVGCGGGRALLRLARHFPNSRFTGIDLCADAFAPALRQAKEEGLENLTFREQDVTGVATFGAFDLILAFDAVHDQKDPQALLTAIRSTLRDDGALLMVEIGGSGRLETDRSNPLGPFLYAISTMHCTPVSLGQGGEGLGTMWGIDLAQQMLTRAGFADATLFRLPHDPINAYFVARA